ncbi:MAG: beta-galactosidase trimerization domain-containing protein, partial [Candidatus Nanopelagicales bacterium]
AVWSMVARGARLVEYWHWHSLHYGAETYWGGILGHSLEPGRIYDELSSVGNELKGAADVVGQLSTHSDVGVLVSAESRWAMEFMAPLSAPGSGWFGDKQSYDRILAAFYRGLVDAGLAADIVAPQQLPDADEMVRRWPVLVVPGLYIAADVLLARLRAYVEAGGHLVLTPRTGYADEDAVARYVVMPGVLRDVVGASYLHFTNLRSAVPIAIADSAELSGAGTGWADELIPDSATVLARYQHPHLREFAAVTTNPFGKGRATYVGTVPDRALSASLAKWLAAVSLDEDPWRSARPASVTCTSSTTPAGQVVRFVHNWGWEQAAFVLPTAVRDVLSRAELDAGDRLALGSWDVRVLLEEPA